MAERALRVYRGPDDAAPLMGIINSLSQQLRNMEARPGLINRLIRTGPDFEVTVTRVGAMAGENYGMEFVTTRYGKVSWLIVLVGSEAIMFSADVLLSPNGYKFPDIVAGVVPEIIVYDSYETNARETCPYIISGSINYASVGKSGWEGWHKHYGEYVGQPETAKESDEIFRPYGRTWSYHQGPIVHWHASMSAVTSVANHIISSRYIDNQKMNYWPHNMLVNFAAGQSPVFFTEIATGNLMLPANPLAFYGKRPQSETSYGEAIVANHPAIVTISGDGSEDGEMVPSQFFWPWIPYMDEIGHFNLLAINGTSVLSYGLNPMYVWDMRYYELDGTQKTETLLTDAAAFNNSTTTNEYAFPIETPSPNPSWNAKGTETRTDAISAYGSSGVKHIPIGSLGGKKGCCLKTEWTTAGSGPVYDYTRNIETTGNFPFTVYQASGYMMAVVVDGPPPRAAGDYINTNVEGEAWNESASNSVSLAQSLMMGDDVIATGISNMAYSLTRSGSSAFSGRFGVSIPERPPEPCSLGGTISHTTHQMDVSTTQDLSVSGAQDCLDYSWSITSGGGSLSASTGTSTTYTSPASNANCANNPIITLSGTNKEGYEEASGVCDTLAIAINVCAENYAGRYGFYENRRYLNMGGRWCECAIFAYYFRCNGSTWGTPARITDVVSYACYGPSTDPRNEAIWQAACAAAFAAAGSDPLDTRWPNTHVPALLTTTQACTESGCCPAQLL